MAKKSSLNKGLQALLGETAQPKSTTPKNKTKKAKQDNKQTNEISISSIVANQYQPRTTFDEKRLKELSDSIKKHGIIQPLLVREDGNKFELVAGERRLRAAKIAGIKKVPVVVAKINDTQSLEIAILENVQREDLNPLEVSKGYQRLKEEFGYTQEQVAKSVGKPRSSVANSLRLLTLPPKIQTALEKGLLSEGHAKVLLGVESTKIEALLDTIVQKQLSVRELEALVADKPTKHHNKKEKSRDELNLESALSSKLGSKVTIEDKKGKGKMVIKYYSYDELDGIIEKISI